jgi:hypothetical protein
LEVIMTSTSVPMLETYPQPINLDLGKLAATIDTLVACSEACTECADACLSEGMVAELTKCIRTNMDCADICATTARVRKVAASAAERQQRRGRKPKRRMDKPGRRMWSNTRGHRTGASRSAQAAAAAAWGHCAGGARK